MYGSHVGAELLPWSENGDDGEHAAVAALEALAARPAPALGAAGEFAAWTDGGSARPSHARKFVDPCPR